MKKLMKAFSLVLLCSVFVLGLSSCKNAGTELADLMIIQGIGVDYEKGSFLVTVEILNNEQSGSPNGNASSDNKTKLYSAKGKTVAEALRMLTSKSGNLPLFAHNRVIVINENLNEKTISDVLEFFIRNYDSRASQLLCIAKGTKAESVIRAKLLQDTVKSEILENLLEESYEQSLIPRVRVIDAVNSLSNKNTILCIPAVEVKKNGENEDYQLSGCALYDENGRVCAYLSEDAAKGITFLTNKVQQGFLTQVLPGGEEITVFINKSKTQYKIFAENGLLHYNLAIDISCDLDEVGSTLRRQGDAATLESVKKAVRLSVVKSIEETLSALQTGNTGDCVGYCKVLELKNTKAYKKYKDDWKNTFGKIHTSVSVDVTVRRIGEETLK